MKFTKICGSFAVAASILGMSSIALAEPYECNEGKLISDMQTTAAMLRCGADPSWDSNNPIWRKGRSASCDIQDSLAKQLDEPRDGINPPPLKKGNNIAAGAANDLLNGKVDDAKLHIANYLAGIAKANLSDTFTNTGGLNAGGWKELFWNAGEDYQMCLEELYPTL